MAKKELTLYIRAKNMLGRGLASAKSGLKSFAGSLKKIAMVGVAAFAGIATGIVAAMIKAQEFNKQIGQISTLTTLTASEVKKQVRGMSAEFGIAKEELTKGLYDALSAGVPKENVFEFMRVASKVAIAGAATTAEAVDILTTTLNAFQMDASRADEASDILFTTVRLGKTTLTELSQSLAQVAPLANASGIALSEVAAGVATLTKQGTPTAQAMTQIRGAIIAMNRELGDGWSKTMTMQQGMQAMADKAGGSNVALKNLTGRVEGMLAILGTTGDKAKGAADDLDQMTKSAGATGAAFKKMSDVNPLNKLWQALNNIVLTAGDAALQMLAPTIEKAARAAARFAENIADWFDDDKIKNIRDQIEGITTALLEGGDARSKAMVAIGDVLKASFAVAAEKAVSVLMSAAPTIGKMIGAAAKMALKALVGGPSTGKLSEAEQQLVSEGKLNKISFGDKAFQRSGLTKQEIKDRNKLIRLRALEIEQQKVFAGLGIDIADNTDKRTAAEINLAAALTRLAEFKADAHKEEEAAIESTKTAQDTAATAQLGNINKVTGFFKINWAKAIDATGNKFKELAKAYRVNLYDKLAKMQDDLKNKQISNQREVVAGVKKEHDEAVRRSKQTVKEFIAENKAKVADEKKQDPDKKRFDELMAKRGRGTFATGRRKKENAEFIKAFKQVEAQGGLAKVLAKNLKAEQAKADKLEGVKTLKEINTGIDNLNKNIKHVISMG